MKLSRAVTILLLASWAFTAVRADTPTTELAIRNQQFTVQELSVPANVKIKLVITNQDSLPAEFESYDLSREVVVPGHSSVTVYIGPLDPGRYNFFNDFNHAAQGWVVVAASQPGH